MYTVDLNERELRRAAQLDFKKVARYQSCSVIEYSLSLLTIGLLRKPMMQLGPSLANLKVNTLESCQCYINIILNCIDYYDHY
jgi:hypothetical protein